MYSNTSGRGVGGFNHLEDNAEVVHVAADDLERHPILPEGVVLDPEPPRSLVVDLATATPAPHDESSATRPNRFKARANEGSVDATESACVYRGCERGAQQQREEK